MKIACPAVETQFEREEGQKCDRSETVICADRTVSKLSEWNIDAD